MCYNIDTHRKGEFILGFWKTYRLPEDPEYGEYRWFLTEDETKVYLTDKEWFNKNTTSVCIHRGYETEEYSTEPISEMIYHIDIEYQILNYFGDRSGMHYRHKEYMLVDGKLYKQVKGEGIEVKRMTKELKGILEELKHL